MCGGRFWEARAACSECYHCIQELIRLANLHIVDKTALNHLAHHLPAFATVVRHSFGREAGYCGGRYRDDEMLQRELSCFLQQESLDTVLNTASSRRPLLV